MVGIVALVLLRGSDPTGGAAAQGPVVASTASPSAASSRSAVAPAPAASGPGPTVASPATVSPTDGPPTAVPPAVVAPASVPPVTVLNNSRVSGLAAKAASRLRAADIAVAEVGNYTGRIPVSTLYFAPGQQSAAESLAAAVDGIDRVLPRPDGLPGSGLTLVVTRDFPA